MEDTIINLTSNTTVLISILGVAGYTTLSTICSGISKVLPDNIEKDTKLLGLKIGKIRGFYNPFMKVVNKIALNTGKAANNPNVQQPK